MALRNPLIWYQEMFIIVNLLSGAYRTLERARYERASVSVGHTAQNTVLSILEPPSWRGYYAH